MPSPWQACSTVVPGGTSVCRPSIVSFTGSGMALLLRRLPPQRGRPIFDYAALHVGLEVTDQPLHRPYRAIGQRADRVAFDLGGDLLKHIELFDRRVALDHALHDPPDPAEAFPTGCALATTFMLVECR